MKTQLTSRVEPNTKLVPGATLQVSWPATTRVCAVAAGAASRAAARPAAANVVMAFIENPRLFSIFGTGAGLAAEPRDPWAEV